MEPQLISNTFKVRIKSLEIKDFPMCSHLVFENNNANNPSSKLYDSFGVNHSQNQTIENVSTTNSNYVLSDSEYYDTANENRANHQNKLIVIDESLDHKQLLKNSQNENNVKLLKNDNLIFIPTCNNNKTTQNINQSRKLGNRDEDIYSLYLRGNSSKYSYNYSDFIDIFKDQKSVAIKNDPLTFNLRRSSYIANNNEQNNKCTHSNYESTSSDAGNTFDDEIPGGMRRSFKCKITASPYHLNAINEHSDYSNNFNENSTLGKVINSQMNICAKGKARNSVEMDNFKNSNDILKNLISKFENIYNSETSSFKLNVDKVVSSDVTHENQQSFGDNKIGY